MGAKITKKLLTSVIGAEHDIKSITTIEEALATALKLQKDEGTYAAAAICILYLSHYKLKFPSNKLRLFYTNIKEEIALPLFDCKAYNSILSAIDDDALESIELIDDKSSIRTVSINKKELFETLDFYTNQ